jgi:hypothetical protein
VSERLSHGEPAFFAGKRMFSMLSRNHHGDGRWSVILPVEPGLQSIMIARDPERFYYPSNVGASGRIGVELRKVSDKDLRVLLEEAWRLAAPKRTLAAWDARAT